MTGEEDEVQPDTLTFIVKPELEGTRLDSYLSSEIESTSRSQLRKAIELGSVIVNGKEITKPAYPVSTGEEIIVRLPERPPLEAVPEDILLNIVFEDDDIIVINKPAGMVTHPGAGVSSGTLANGLVFYLNKTATNLPRRGGTSRPGIVHRLDIGTSGLIIAAKTDQAHLALAEQFESRTVFKSYIALVYGTFINKEGQKLEKIDAPIGRDPKNRVKMAVRNDGRAAITLYKVRENFDLFTLLDVEIKTGRTHQIRVHLAHIKHPIAGDSTYDQGRANNISSPKIKAALSKLNRPFLHAGTLRIQHPTTNEMMEFNAPLPEHLTHFLSVIGGNS